MQIHVNIFNSYIPLYKVKIIKMWKLNLMRRIYSFFSGKRLFSTISPTTNTLSENNSSPLISMVLKSDMLKRHYLSYLKCFDQAQIFFKNKQYLEAEKKINEASKNLGILGLNLVTAHQFEKVEDLSEEIQEKIRNVIRPKQ